MPELTNDPVTQTPAPSTGAIPAPDTSQVTTIKDSSGDVDFKAMAREELNAKRSSESQGIDPSKVQIPGLPPQQTTPRPMGDTIDVGNGLQLTQKELKDLFAIFGGDKRKVALALRNPGRVMSILESHYTPKLQERASLLKENEELKARLSQVPQYIPPPQQQPPQYRQPAAPVAEGQRPPQPGAPSFAMLDENHPYFGDLHKIINQQNKVLSQVMQKQNTSQTTGLGHVENAMLGSQYEDMRRIVGDDATQRALEAVAQHFDVKMGSDGKPDFRAMPGEKAVQALDFMKRYGQSYSSQKNSDEEAIQEGLKAVPWVQDQDDEEKLLESAVRTIAFDKVMGIHRRDGQYPSKEMISKIVEDTANGMRLRFEKKMQVLAEDALKNRQPLVGSGQGRKLTPGEIRPEDVETIKDKDGNVDFKAMAREEHAAQR